MGAVQARDGASQLAGLRIDHIQACTAREIKTMSRGVNAQVIPAALAAGLPAVNDFVRLLRVGGRNGGKQAAEQSRGCEGVGKKTKCALHGHGKAPIRTGEEYHPLIAVGCTLPDEQDGRGVKMVECKAWLPSQNCLEVQQQYRLQP